ncbi:anti-sigma factor domain-containing protein [Pseudobacteroides cellulosolvens]|uniref:Anti-sigma factor RsgI, N-terminal n=1 Tax=Pseudobacteroides cellulosolvens ATCC 35603 = DSM 2933 TaxID=398512 RepID=A0A0L6JI13_9FIRM|nr:anti-sigma factor domain-containing protein [Pseudobacteroides cellulosolvens]KNY25369.1 Anti-sigma factor RsgI, N-terminal [Pseudobacteroides cellulosolvens ATCC 35603 = DSM 2933]
MNKGTILEIENDIVLVMTGDCDFIHLKRKSGMFVGQQIQFTSDDIKKEKKPFNILPLAVSAAAILLIASLYFIFFQKTSVNDLSGIYSFVDIDINPGIEFMLDKDNKIKKAVPLNNDGQKLLKDIDYKNMYLEKAITDIIAKSEDLGYINVEESNILASVSLNDAYKYYGKNTQEQKEYIDNLVKELNISLEDKADKYLVTKTSPIIKRKASKNNLSMGRQIYYDNMRKNGEEITLDNARKEEISTIIENLSEYKYTPEENDNTSSPARITPTNKANTEPSLSTKSSALVTPKPTPKNTATKSKPTPTIEKVVYGNNTLHVTASTKNGNVVLKWTPLEGKEFLYYKIVISKKNSKPKYPDEGYMYALPDINTSSVTLSKDSSYNGGDFGGKLVPGEKYYFGITAVFNNKKIYSNVISMKYPGTLAPTPKPSAAQSTAPKLTASIGNNAIKLSWTPNKREGFVYYKVVISKSNPHPIYPEDGYMWFSNEETSYSVYSSTGYNGGDFGGKLESGQKYYFSITYVYNDKKISSNTLYLTCP